LILEIRKSVTFAEQNPQKHPTGEGQFSIRRNLAELRELTKVVEQRAPMIRLKTVDEVQQLKHFLITYYRPLFTSEDL